MLPIERFTQNTTACIVAALIAVYATPSQAADNRPVPVQSRVFEIEYGVDERALPLESVQLWYTLDEGESWHLYGYDDDRQSPFTFHAPTEGLYGVFFVLSNAIGPSSSPPARWTQAQAKMFVDFTPPVVQLHTPQQTSSLGQRVLQIRWAAIDAHLSPRPIEIHFKTLPSGEWMPVTATPLANTGRYDWRLPAELVGPITIQLTASDLGGHRAQAIPQTVQITQLASDAILDTGYSTGSNRIGPPLNPATTQVRPVADSTKSRAMRLYSEALRDRDRGDYRQGIIQLREAVRLDPTLTDAFAVMGNLLYLIGDPGGALRGYNIAIQQQPSHRDALRGAALAHKQRNEFNKASQRLRTILRYNPNDAEVWMNLGDIAIFQGDELLARECYTRATQIDRSADAVIQQAQKRLELMKENSKNR